MNRASQMTHELNEVYSLWSRVPAREGERTTLVFLCDPFNFLTGGS